MDKVPRSGVGARPAQLSR
jgi:hypothetical protein